MLEREGCDERVRAPRAARARRRAPAREALGLKLVAPTRAEPGGDRHLSCRHGIDGGKLVKLSARQGRRQLRRRAGSAEGQDRAASRTSATSASFDIVTAIAALEMALAKFGARVDFGTRRRRGADECWWKACPPCQRR